jgi:hypothetical protein
MQCKVYQVRNLFIISRGKRANTEMASLSKRTSAGHPKIIGLGWSGNRCHNNRKSLHQLIPTTKRWQTTGWLSAESTRIWTSHRTVSAPTQELCPWVALHCSIHMHMNIDCGNKIPLFAFNSAQKSGIWHRRIRLAKRVCAGWRMELARGREKTGSWWIRSRIFNDLSKFHANTYRVWTMACYNSHAHQTSITLLVRHLRRSSTC